MRAGLRVYTTSASTDRATTAVPRHRYRVWRHACWRLRMPSRPCARRAPTRPARPAAQAAEELQRESDTGRLDADAVRAVVSAAGQRPRQSRRQLPRGLSEREVEVLALVARGLSTKAIAAKLSVSPKTAEAHVQHIYDKLDLKTRAGAAVFAMEHDLIHGPG